MHEIARLYLHIGNSGVTFSVADAGHGPVVRIHSSSFGNNEITQEVAVGVQELTALSRLFQVASEHKGFSESYCHKAENNSSYPLEILEGLAATEKKCCGSSKKKVEEKTTEGNSPIWGKMGEWVKYDLPSEINLLPPEIKVDCTGLPSQILCLS